MDGRQSVPRAELYALMAIVLYMAVLPIRAKLTIVSDNKAVVDGYNKGPKLGQGNLDDLWERFWAIHDCARAGGAGGWEFENFGVITIKSHTLEPN